jgi:serpin B
MNGAGGDTLEEMRNAQGLANIPVERLNRVNADIWPRLAESNDDFQIRVANAIFIDGSVPFEQAFLDLNARFYGAELQSLDFKNPAAVPDINDWSSKATNGKIPKIVDDLQGQMILCNAIYFNAKWVAEFDEDGTRDRPFTTPNGSKETVKMMYRMGTVPYVETPELQAIRMAYKGGKSSMVVVLPKAEFGRVLDSLDAKNWAELCASLKPALGHINLPKFTTRFAADLKPALQALGMKRPFEINADFQAIYKLDPVFINRVIHKTFIDVAEKGTEAAAVTAVEMKVGSAPMEPERPFQFNADRPFIYAIVDDETGLIIFLGTFVGS